MTIDEYHVLVDNEIVCPVEFLDGRLVTGSYELALSPQQMHGARRAGLSPRSYVDAVLKDPDALAELRGRLSDES
jgi:hypothetical protein